MNAATIRELEAAHREAVERHLLARKATREADAFARIATGSERTRAIEAAKRIRLNEWRLDDEEREARRALRKATDANR